LFSSEIICRAKSIQNKAKINSEKSVGELKILLAHSEKEIAKLKAKTQSLEEELSLLRSGGVVVSAATAEGAPSSKAASVFQRSCFL
jgi:cell division protein FtsB